MTSLQQLCRAAAKIGATKLTVLGLIVWPVVSQAASPQPSATAWVPVPTTASFLTGDSWTDRGASYRLYGVQACLRGTFFTNAHGQRRDCGEASLAMLVALIRDLHPLCSSMTSSQASSATMVFCVAQPANGAAAGSRIDLGTALIATGFAFAAVGPDGAPIHAPYAVAESVARQSRAGLWAFDDLPHPNTIIARALASPRSATGGVADAQAAVPPLSQSTIGDDHP